MLLMLKSRARVCTYWTAISLRYLTADFGLGGTSHALIVSADVSERSGASGLAVCIEKLLR